MEFESIRTLVDEPLLNLARGIAERRKITLDQLIRTALATEIAKEGVPVDVVEDGLRHWLESQFTQAIDWHDLVERLRQRGMVLQNEQAGPAIVSMTTGTLHFYLQELGLDVGDLKSRFGAPLPGMEPGARILSVLPIRLSEADEFVF
ncbi:hypothetical protein [Pseudoruegeria sp. HB172150]|uniref:hypothetical protein n=1 Tax=Pseudoruegeria sp. HB172150 TaxID=2721164 RepID=UPI0015516C8B|nr:hypothetical protein [Pseudoruegeria sp. HB172150]